MVRLTFFVLLFVFVFCTCRNDDNIGPECEKIDGEANVRDSIKGEILFTLKNNASVQCGKLKNRWYKIGTRVKINQQQWHNRQIPAGIELFDIDGSEVGKSSKELVPFMVDSSDNGYSALILGYTHMNNIKVESFVEYAIPEYLKELNSYTLASFNKLFKRYKFKEVDSFDGYKSFAIYENEIINPTPGYRIALFFKEDILVAIAHSRNLEISKTVDIDIVKGYRCLLFLSLDEKNIFIDQLNAFLLKTNLERDN